MNSQAHDVEKTRTGPKDFFLHLGIIVTLYVSAISLVNLLFAVINKTYPDALAAGYYYDGTADTIKWTVAALIIMFPIYLLLGWLYNKELKATFVKKTVGIRKWLVYLTLFLAGLVLAIDLVTLVYTFLGGEITIRFILKVIVVFVVVGLIFAYYIYDLMHDAKARAKSYMPFALVATAIVVASVIAGFYVIGSPTAQRNAQLDQNRINDLQNIQSQVTTYWQQKGTLPKTLSDLENALTGAMIPLDPETKQAYEYKATGNLSFKLCANFETSSLEQRASGPVQYGPKGEIVTNYWSHGIGNTCFDRTIDPEMFPRVSAEGAPIKVPNR